MLRKGRGLVFSPFFCLLRYRAESYLTATDFCAVAPTCRAVACAVPCRAVPRAVPCHAVLCRAVPCAVLCCAVLCNPVPSRPFASRQ